MQHNVRFEGSDANHSPRHGTMAVEAETAEQAVGQAETLVLDMYPGFTGVLSTTVTRQIPAPLPAVLPGGNGDPPDTSPGSDF